MNLSKAISLASKWSEGYVCSLREGEAKEYHRLCLEALRSMRVREEPGVFDLAKKNRLTVVEANNIIENLLGDIVGIRDPDCCAVDAEPMCLLDELRQERNGLDELHDNIKRLYAALHGA